MLRIIGLFIVVFSGFAISTALGFSDNAKIIGAIVGATTLLIING